ncbi:MAG: hypothetical protein BMS9Abin02_0800 [Anaerolineae bacterium]|nr:MAG: hypothetical protein BMS9Abin02_0800 [Anaerolineae bacterium]
MADLAGQTIAHYRLDDWIGDGGMGSVYKAYDLNLERITALKLMHPHYARLPEFRARLAQEAKTSAQLDHTSIVRIYDFGEFEERLYIAMEYIGGGNLRSHLTRLQKSNRYLPLDQSLQIVAHIADALDYAHENGVVHRDVKPSNILLKRLKKPDRPNEQPFRAVLTDFGLVKVIEGQELTESGMTVGTPTYMSPEQCQGIDLDGRSDLYSLGVVLYELVTNQLPFELKSLSEAMGVHLRGTAPKSPTSIRPDLPSVMDSLILRALYKAPEDRYKSGSEMSANLRSAISALGGLTTQIYSREDLDINDDGQAAAETGGYSLRIETPGQETRLIQLTRHSINIGRNADNDIVLPSDGVSRNHAHLEYQSGQWLVTDHGGINGTMLNNRRLFSEEEAVLKIGSKLEIGPYVLQIEGPAADSNDAGDMPITELPTEGRLAVAAAYNRARAETGEPLSLFLASESITVEAGQQTILKAEVVNNSSQDDRVNLQIRGLPTGWLKIQNTFSVVSAGQSTIIPLVIHPPKDAKTRSGKQRFLVELQSQGHPDVNLAVSGRLDIVSFEAFEVSMRPRRLKLPDRLYINIKNIGNFRNEFSVHGRDIEGIVRFRGERNHISLIPGQTARVEMVLESRRPKLLGGSDTFSFEIEVSGGHGSTQVLSGTARRSSVMPVGVIYIGIFFVAFLCVLAALFGIVRGRFFSGPTTTTISGIFLGASATADRATSAAAAADATSQSATQLAATAVMLGDRDGDGLSDLQENVVGTDPDNPDSDNDGLLDGEEVLTWATNPLSQDTDSDELSDGSEVLQYGTSPTNQDTDGDGLSDGLEIITGTNPLDSIDPVPSVTITAALPAPTQEPTPLPSTTPTDQPSPTSTTSPSPLPTDTPTPESTQMPTLEPTDTPEFLMACTGFPPEIDGKIKASEWENGPMLSFAPEGNPQRLVQVYLDRDASSFYLGYIINDPAVDLATDVINIAIDGNYNRDVPDGSDRLIQVLRDGTGRMQYGLGDDNNGSYWESNYQSDNWRVAVGETGDGQWVVEIVIDIAKEIPDLVDGGFFGHMILAGYSDILGVWPTGADLLDSSTWQPIASSACP